MTTKKRSKKATPVETLSEFDSLVQHVLAQGSHELDDLSIVRQSADKALANDSDSEQDLSQFQKMLDGTCAMDSVRNLEGVETIRGAGAELVRQTEAGAKLRESLNAIPLIAPGSRVPMGYLIVFGRTGWVLAVDSAARANVVRSADYRLTLENYFTLTIARLITRYQVSRVHVAAFHRLVRHRQVMAPLLAALTDPEHRTGCQVFSDLGEMDLRTGPGKMMFDMGAQIAEITYVGAVSGLSKGVHYLPLTGLWPKGEKQLPACGYQFRGANDQTPVPDVEKAGVIRDVVTRYLAGDTFDTIARHLGETYGYVHGVAADRQGAKRIDELAYPGTAVKNLLLSGLPLWLTGRYNYTCRIPQWLDNEHLRTEIRRKHGNPEKKITETSFTIDFHHDELPGGTWLDAKKLEAAIQKLAATSPSALRDLRAGFTVEDTNLADRLLGGISPKQVSLGGRGESREDRKPLAGIGEWIDGDTQFRLSARHKTNYVLISRPVSQAFDAARRPQGWRPGAKTVIHLGTSELHVGLAEAIADAIEAGVPWARSLDDNGTGEIVPGDEKTIRGIADQIDAARARLALNERKLDAALRTGSEKTIDRLTVAGEQIEQEIATLSVQLGQAQAAVTSGRLLDPLAVGELGNVRNVLAALAQVEDRAPAELNNQLKALLVDLRVKPVDHDIYVEVSAKVQLMTSDGPLVLGPIVTKIRSNRWHYQRSNRAQMIFETMFRDGRSLEEAAPIAGYQDVLEPARHVHARLAKDDLIPVKGLRSALIYCPLPDVRRVIWAELQARETGQPFQVPAGIDPAYAAQVRKTYTDPSFTWTAAWCSDSHRLAREVIAAVAATGDVGMPWDTLLGDVLPAIGFTGSKSEIVEIATGKGSSQRARGVVVYDAIVERSTPWHNHAERRVWAKSCPYCGTRTLTHVLRVPEIPGGLLCETCRRTPSLPTVIYPVEYLTRWSGARGTGSTKTSKLRQGTLKEN